MSQKQHTNPTWVKDQRASEALKLAANKLEDDGVIAPVGHLIHVMTNHGAATVRVDGISHGLHLDHGAGAVSYELTVLSDDGTIDHGHLAQDIGEQVEQDLFSEWLEDDPAAREASQLLTVEYALPPGVTRLVLAQAFYGGMTYRDLFGGGHHINGGGDREDL